MVSLGVSGVYQLGVVGGECERYRGRGVVGRVGACVGSGGLLLLLPAALAVPVLAPSSPLTHLFPGASQAAMRMLVGVGGVAGLWAAAAGGVVGGSRVAHGLGRGGLAPGVLGRVAPTTATPWPAALLTGTLAALAASLGSSWLLVRAAGVGVLGAGVAGAAGVVAARYRPIPRPVEGWWSTAPASLDEIDTRQVAVVEWAGGGRSRSGVVEAPGVASWRAARFLLSTFLANVTAAGAALRGAHHLALGVWVWAAVGVCVGGCVVCLVGLWLQPRHPPPSPTTLLPARPPLLPLLALAGNLLLLLHLPLPALATGVTVWVLAGAAWAVWGHGSSREALLRRALLTHPGTLAPRDLL